MRRIVVVGVVQLVFLVVTLGLGVVVANSLDGWVCGGGCAKELRN